MEHLKYSSNCWFADTTKCFQSIKRYHEEHKANQETTIRLNSYCAISQDKESSRRQGKLQSKLLLWMQSYWFTDYKRHVVGHNKFVCWSLQGVQDFSKVLKDGRTAVWLALSKLDDDENVRNQWSAGVYGKPMSCEKRQHRYLYFYSNAFSFPTEMLQIMTGNCRFGMTDFAYTSILLFGGYC